MGKLSKHCGKVEEIEIEGDKFKIYPIKTKDQDLLFSMGNKESESMNKVIKISLKDELMTDEELNNLTIGFKTTIIAAILKANGLEDKLNEAEKKLTAESKQPAGKEIRL